MSSFAPPSLQKRWPGPQKTCPDCGEIVPARLTFCPNCSYDLRFVPENVRSAPDSRAQFQIPAFLLATPEHRRFDEREAGTGLIWLGLALLTIPVVTRNISPLSLGAWAVGVVLTGAGIARARKDASAMLRAGALTAAAGLLTLMLVGEHVVRRPSPPAGTGSNRAGMTPTADTERETPGDALATILTGANPMYRGAPDHSGILPGPGIDGNPYRVWRYDTGGDLRSTPAISGAVAYFGTRNGYLVALDLLTHRPKWSFDLGGYPVRSSPALADRTVYLANGFSVFAVDADTGRQRWKVAIDYAGESSPTVVEGIVYVASKKNRLYALDAATGEQHWSYKTNGLIFGSPSVVNDLVIIGGDEGALFALDRASGHLVWKANLGSGIYSTVAIAGDRVFVTTRDRTTVALDLASGKERWSYPVGGSASPAVANGVVYIGSDDGAIYAIDAEAGGDPIWLFATGSAGGGSPIVVGDRIYLSAGATITALNRETGTVAWQYPAGEEITTDLVVLDGYLFAGDEHGYFYAITGDAHLATPETES